MFFDEGSARANQVPSLLKRLPWLHKHTGKLFTIGKLETANIEEPERSAPDSGSRASWLDFLPGNRRQSPPCAIMS